MKHTVLSIGVAGLALLSCVARPQQATGSSDSNSGKTATAPANSQTNDSVQIRDIEPPPKTWLLVSPGHATRIRVVTSYALSSADRAALSVFAEEYPESAGGCRGAVHQTNGGSQLLIKRGTGTATIDVIWPANSGAGARPLNPSGYVAVGANFFTPDGNTQIRNFGLFANVCYHFAPEGAPGKVSAEGRPNTGANSRPNPPSSPPPAVPVFYRWQPASNGAVPPGAVIAGWQKYQPQQGSTAITTQGPLYLCRASLNGGIYPGKVVKNNCNFSAANGKENAASNYEVLTAQKSEYSLDWQLLPTRPANAVAGGRYGEDLYVCQLQYQGGIHPGWVNVQGNGTYVCSIGYNGKEADLPGFAYLVVVKGQRID
jgi:hypothetical protein